MDRREFLKQVGLWSAGIILTPPVFDLMSLAESASDNIPEIFTIKGTDLPAMVRRMIEALGGIQGFVKTGDKVVIKPNIGWDRTIEQGANTHPLIVSELVKLCLDAGASKVSVFDRTCNEERRCYQNSGMAPALEKIKDKRFRLDHVEDRHFIPVTLKSGQVLKEWAFHKDALEADCYINVPKAKHHSLSGLSLGMKNIMGAVGGSRGRLHYDLGPKLADLNTVIRPKLTLIDASRVIIKNGPQGGDLSDVKILDTLIASRDPVAVDAYATTLFGLLPRVIEATVEAHKRGLGQMDLSQCSIRSLEA
ncbi:MAG: DUF362 domain-containing protein [Desulfobacula sp.]|jgi:uncharacterized protein (DUF362 family)